MNKHDNTEMLEVNLLLEAIYQHCGYDFRQYARGSVMRSLKREIERAELNHIAELIPLVLRDRDFLDSILKNLSINVTEFFRDPRSYATLINHVFPALKSYPFFKIWHAGCSNGKEVYSLAILLDEAGLLDRCLIYATDFNHDVLAKAKEGIYERDEIESIKESYVKAGGQGNIDKYFTSHYNMAKIKPRIRKHITFAHHNLATDSVFGEMQLIVCRNVIIYFNSHLKDKVFGLFDDSLCSSGFLLLGATESMSQSRFKKSFVTVCQTNRLYKKAVASSDTVCERLGINYV